MKKIKEKYQSFLLSNQMLKNIMGGIAAGGSSFACTASASCLSGKTISCSGSDSCSGHDDNAGSPGTGFVSCTNPAGIASTTWCSKP